MSRAARQYYATQGVSGTFPFTSSEANYRAPDFQARLEKYADLALTTAQKAELAPLGLRWLPSDLPQLQHSFVQAPTKDMARKLIGSFFLLDLAYTSLAHLKNALRYCDLNRNEKSASLLLGIFNCVNGHLPAGAARVTSGDVELGNGANQNIVTKHATRILMNDELIKNFPGVTAPMGDPNAYGVPIDFRVETDSATGVQPPGSTIQPVYGFGDTYLSHLLTMIRDGTYSEAPYGQPNGIRGSAALSRKVLARVYGIDQAQADIDAEQMAIMTSMGGLMVWRKAVRPARARGGALAAGQLGAFIPNVAVSQLGAQRVPPWGVAGASLSDYMGELTKIRVGRFTASQFEHDTILKECVTINREIYRILRSGAGAPVGPAVFLTGERRCDNPTNRAWRIKLPPKPGAAVQDPEYIIMRGEKPIDASGVLYPDAEEVCLDHSVPEPVTGPPGRTVPVRVSVPAGAGATSAPSAQRAASQRASKGVRKAPAKKASAKKAPAKKAAPAKKK